MTSGDAGQEHPDWAPDGQSLVFEADFTTLWMVGVDGTDAKQLFSCGNPCQSIQDGAWSPDGTEIAFMTAESSDQQTTSRSAILVLDVASGSVRTVFEDTSGVVWLFQPRWSPDGRSLVVERDTFASDSLAEEQVVKRELVVVASEGGSDPDVIATGLESPDWSPLGDAIVAVREGNLVTLDLAGGAETPLTDYSGGSPRALQPTYTPDGLSIVFTLDAGSPTAALVPVGGGEITMLGGGRLMTHTRLQPL